MIKIYVIVFLVIFSIFTCLYWIYTRNTRIVRIKEDQIVEFKSSFDLTGLPIITFYQDSKKYNFLIDSGSNLSYVNQASKIKMQMSNTKDTFMGANGTDISCQYALLDLYLNDTKYEHQIAVADLSTAFTELKQQYGVSLTGIIGCDFMNKYKYCIDFKELVVYSRK